MAEDKRIVIPGQDGWDLRLGSGNQGSVYVETIDSRLGLRGFAQVSIADLKAAIEKLEKEAE